MDNLYQENVSLKPFNTFGIEAKARYFSIIHDLHQLTILLTDSSVKNTSKFILGGGSNILLTKDFQGLVIKNEFKGIRKLNEDRDHVWIEIGAGENWHDFVMYCVEHHYAGIENLALIPGTVGAAPIQNIGAYGVELCDVFVELHAFEIQTGKTYIITKEECHFSYRDSIFKNIKKDQYIILSIVLKLNKNPIFHTQYGNIKETLESMQVNELSIKAISEAVIQIRKNKLPDPKQIGNAGSFFKNPLISKKDFLVLQKSFPSMPHFLTQDPDVIKIPAGWLVESCGWKGKRVSEVGVYDKQALIIVNYGQGKSSEIQALAKAIQNSVEKEFGIQLIPEVNYI